MSSNKDFMAFLFPRFIISIFIFSMVIPNATPLSFNFPTFDPNDNEVVVQGDASKSDGEILLTLNREDKGLNDSIGRAIYQNPLRLWDSSSGQVTDFTTHFSFVINSQNHTPYADGIAFFLAPQHFPLPEKRDGSGLGLVCGEQMHNSTKYPFVAVEFDTYSNNNLEDPDYDHVGININTMNSTDHHVRWNSSVKDGKETDVWISYDAASKNLNVIIRGDTFLEFLHRHVDFKSILPELVTFGFSAATGTSFEIHTLKSWRFNSSFATSVEINIVPAPGPSAQPSSEPEGQSIKNLVLELCAGGAITVLVLVCGLGIIWYCSRKKRNVEEDGNSTAVFDMSMEEEFGSGIGPKKFSYDELAQATNNFAKEEKLGQGGFGAVYRGFLRKLKLHVAVKRISEWSKQGKKEYASEVRIISRLRHKNLVQLIGWCHERRGLLLVYEFMSNGSLDLHLFKDKSMLTWVQRYKIVQGLASALLYLHEEWEQCVVHRDIKSSNVMLDSSFNAKLGDFGLARLVDHAKGSQTTVLAGTFGYIAPECARTGKASKESDVYSFGVVVLETACGRKPLDPDAEESMSVLIEWVWELYGTGKLLEAADARLCRGDFDEQQMKQLMIVGLWCVHPDYNIRPSIKQAIQVLNGEAPLPLLPSKMPLPTYSAPQVNFLPPFSVSVSPILPR